MGGKLPAATVAPVPRFTSSTFTKGEGHGSTISAFWVLKVFLGTVGEWGVSVKGLS